MLSTFSLARKVHYPDPGNFQVCEGRNHEVRELMKNAGLEVGRFADKNISVSAIRMKWANS